MKIFKVLLLIVSVVGLFACGNSSKEYSYSISGKEIHLYIPAPRMGVAGIGKLSYGNKSFRLGDIDKDIYNEFTGIVRMLSDRKGSFDVYLYWINHDQYGREVYEEKGQIGTLNSDEVRKYVDLNRYQHSKDAVSNMIDRVTQKWIEDMRREAAKRQLGID